MTLNERIIEFHSLRQRLVEQIAEESGVDPRKFVDKAIPQSELFMAEIIRVLHDLYLSLPRTEKSVLDVGPQCFGGTALLERLHAPTTFNRLKLSVSAIDITDKFDLLRDFLCPNVEFIHADIFAVDDRVWDTVICSHVIEHVPYPARFCRRLQDLARDFVIIACPWKEDPLSTSGHINSINEQLIGKLGGRDLNEYVNYNWGKNRKVCTFWLPGFG